MGLGDIASGIANTVEDAASYVYHGAAGGENRADGRERQKGYDSAQHGGNAAREKIYTEQQRLRQEVPSDADPTAIRAKDNWDSWDHAAIKNMTDRLNSGQVHSAAQGWSSLVGKIAADVAGYQHAMQQAVGAKWEGAAAESAEQSAAAYSQQGQKFGHAIELTGTKISEAATGAERTRAMVPPPKDFSIREAAVSGVLNPVAGGINIFQQKQAQNAAHAEAVNVMNTVYTPVYVQSDAGVPTFAPPAATFSPNGDFGGGVGGHVNDFPAQPPASRHPVGQSQRPGGDGGNNPQWSPPPRMSAPLEHARPATGVDGAVHGGSVGAGNSLGGAAARGDGHRIRAPGCGRRQRRIRPWCRRKLR